MTSRKLAVVSAGLSQPSSTRLLADQLAAATRAELERHDVALERRPAGPAQVPAHVDVQVIELRDHAHDLMNHMLTGFPSTRLKEAIDAVAGAGGLIAVTPIFNASYSGLFKSFFDVIDGTALADKPVLAAATGGTARHSLALEHALRPMFTYLHAVVVPTAVYAATEDWAGGAGDTALRGRVRRAARELADQMVRRDEREVVDPFALATTFEELLGSSVE
jgi:FMN reductase